MSAKAALEHHYFRFPSLIVDYFVSTKKMCRKVLKIKKLSFSDLDKNTLPAKPGQFDLPI